MKKTLGILAATITTPAAAHEIAADHAHMGETVLFHMSPLLVVGAGIAALATFVIFRTKGAGKAGEDRHDSR